MEIPVFGTLGADNVGPLAEALFAPPRNGGELVYDLRAVNFVCPFALATLAALLNADGRLPEHVQILCPTGLGPLSYMGASGFFSVLPDEVEVSDDFGIRSMPASDAPTVLPLTGLREGREIVGVLDTVESRVEEVLGTGNARWQATRGALRATIKELCQNIFDHARSGGGWVAAQQYERRDGVRFVEIGIADSGVGVRQSLSSRYPDLLSEPDGLVLQETLANRLTSKSTPGSSGGTGYAFLQQATGAHDGSFFLRSGAGSVRRRRGATDLRRDDSLDYCPGTHLQVTITCG